ncbi:EAL domain-containing protein [Gammaproteobacteria bacterium AB-CW1]|uniref:EAL domain-containing protein n=1 Tax=Natronospira elongata TaxID=3110268 RepID=A0AAP6JI40_9GAMM|nr:EAL domain-containing protein [Gammaproteobacteria bacterium AB-CW1]
MIEQGDLVTAALAAQAVLSAVLAVFFLYFLHDRRRPFLRLWGLSFLALAIHVVLSLLTYRLLMAGLGPGLRLPVSVAALAAVYAQVALLVAGVVGLAYRRFLTPRHLAVVVIVVALLGGATALIGAFGPDAASLRVFVRLGVKNFLLAAAFMGAAWVILRQRSSPVQAGALLAAGAMIAYGLHLLHTLAIQVLGPAGVWTAPYAPFLPIGDLVLYALIGLGLVTWLFEHERAEARVARSEVSRLSFFDPLTGLPNRRNVRVQLANRIRVLSGTGLKVAFAFLDLERFRRVNDSLGHANGDKLLRSLAERLDARRPAQATVARISSDEFAVILTDLPDEAEARTHLDYLMDAVREPVHVGGHDIHLECACGYALYPDDAEDERALMRAADLAHSSARRRGGGPVRYRRIMEVAADERLVLESELRRAIPDGQLRLLYQPIVDAEGTVRMVEALVRWQHPERGLLLPTEFLSMATTAGLASSLDYWVMESACRQIVSWRDQGVDLRVAVNLSANLFEAPALPSTVERILRRSSLRPSDLQLEITEQVAMEDIEAGNATIERLNEVGVALALDDFGTGYSSLSWLQQLPVSRVKIDRSFIQEIEQAQGLAIVRSITDLAHALGLRVTAEGVESAQQWALLRQLGCDLFQGFHFSQPLAASEVRAFAQRRRLAQL